MKTIRTLFFVVSMARTLLAGFILSPTPQTVTAGQSVALDAVVSDLGTPVGSFDIFIGYDQSLLTPVAVTFGPYLGSVGAFEALTSFQFSPGIVEATEVSLLANADLESLQPSTVTLAELSFVAVRSGEADFIFRGGPIDDGDGNLIAGSKTPVPEPDCVGLLLLGVLGLAVAATRYGARPAAAGTRGRFL